VGNALNRALQPDRESLSTEVEKDVLVRSIVYAVSYVTIVMGALPYVFARWLGAGSPPVAVVGAGAALAAAGFALFLWCVVLFVSGGRGTQSPMEPPTRLVIKGPYRLVRNPMLLGNLVVLLGEAVMFASPGILVYALGFFAVCQLIMVKVEEPSLAERFGGDYESYARSVPRWFPALTRRPRQGPP
jgi:protein-S-isoprenylcysteine O-methyltransferase Ste14